MDGLHLHLNEIIYEKVRKNDDMKGLHVLDNVENLHVLENENGN